MRQRQLILYAAIGAVAYWWVTRKAAPAMPTGGIRAQDQIDQLAAMSQMHVPAADQSGAIVTGPHDSTVVEQAPTLMEPWPGAGYKVPVYDATTAAGLRVRQ